MTAHFFLLDLKSAVDIGRIEDVILKKESVAAIGFDVIEVQDCDRLRRRSLFSIAFSSRYCAFH